jgi:hypothetical protein
LLQWVLGHGERQHGKLQTEISALLTPYFSS